MQSNIKIHAKFKCIIGLLEYERLEEQKVELFIDAQSSGFLDYAKVTKYSKKYLKKKEFKTIEKAISKLAKKLKRKFKHIKSLKIELYKTEVLKNARLGAYINKRY